MNTQTIINGKHVKNYDNFRELISNIKQWFVGQKEYIGYPNLPNNYLEGYDIYDKADEYERYIIFSHLFMELIEALRHWKVDKDELWTEEGRKKHKEFMDKLENLSPYMKKGWDKFW